ncbi:MAG: hypothetical protein IJ335_00840 [Lachnospiraceae bacterium]|nr:hypothetical protein [Lachnospiraceae bacterium]
MVAFANTFLSYVVLMLIIVVVAGVAITIGITLRKRKNNKLDTAIIENNTEE